MQALLLALQFRRDYKCLAGDKVMLDGVTQAWLDRFASAGAAVRQGARVNPATPKLGALAWAIQPEPPGRALDLGEFELAAVDFHVSDIDKRLGRELGRDVAEVRSLMWRCSSSVTTKAPLEGPEPPEDAAAAAAWGTIEPRFEAAARRILQERVTM